MSSSWTALVKHTTVVFVILAIGLAMVLFSIKYQVQDLEGQLSRVHRQIEVERRAHHVLQAEWSYLTDPERLRRLAERHLDLAPLGPRQVGSFAALPRPFAPDSPGRENDATTPVAGLATGRGGQVIR
ncbi:MAG: hypothetical protein EA406_05685 [Rhodospirillales bacterium]|nr:MAG: hypothetical protein EA406_05685 [Rhodospirillales bacterium]